jgi:hypothetical protein
MLPPRKWRLPIFFLAVTCLVPSLSAEIRQTRVHHGKKAQCIHGGFSMIGGGRVCGPQGYARVFTGTVQSAVDVGDTDKRLELIPDEARHLAGLTDQGILTGSVVRIGATRNNLNPTAVPNHRMVAKSRPSGPEYAAFTNLKGRFEFELPPGTYDVTAAREQGLRDAEPWTPRVIELGDGLHPHIGNADIRRA